MTRKILSDLRTLNSLGGRERVALMWGLFYVLKNSLLVSLSSPNKTQWICQENPLAWLGQDLALEPAVQAIERLARRLRPEPSCLIRALALRDLLKRSSIAAEIQLRVRRAQDGKFMFHALVFANGRIVLGGQDNWEDAIHLRRQPESNL